MSDYSAICDWICDLLQEPPEAFVATRLNRYLDSTVARLVDVYPLLVSYDALQQAGGTDLTFFNEGIAHLVAARLRIARAKQTPLGEMIFRLAGDQEERFSAPRIKATTLEEDWEQIAYVALGRVSAIKNVILARAASFSRFVVVGPTRAARDAGYSPTLLTSTLRLLSEDVANEFENDLPEDD